MATITVSGIVLRSVNYRDNDRILTLLTPGNGRMDVLSRGCRRPKSPLMSASDLFCTGEYVLFAQTDRFLLTSCTLHDSFYPLRMDYGLLSCGVYLLNLCEAAAQPGEEHATLFWMLVKALHRLAYGQESRRSVISGFLLHYAVILGYKPRLNHCVHCGTKLLPDAKTGFDCEAGGLVCPNCPQVKSSLPIAAEQAKWLRAVLKEGIESAYRFPPQAAPFSALQCYVETRLDKPLKSLPVLEEQEDT